jgi:hypothetical protein
MSEVAVLGRLAHRWVGVAGVVARSVKAVLLWLAM